MGLFSSKTTISVSSVAYNIAGDAAGRQNFLKQSLVYLTAADQSIGEKLPRMYLRSLGVKIKRAYKHAAALPQGLPTASIQVWEYQEFESAVQLLLDTEHGVGRFKVEDTYITRDNTAPAIENYLNITYGWDSVTGLMTRPPAGFTQSANIQWRYEPPQGRFGDTSPKLSRDYVIEFRHLAVTVVPDLVTQVSLNTVNGFATENLVAMVSEWLQSTRSDLTTTRAFTTGDVNNVVVTPVTTTVGSRVTNTTNTVTITTDGTTTTIRTQIVDATTSETVSHSYKLGVGDWPTLDILWANRRNVEQTYFPSIPFRVNNVDVLNDKFAETENFKQVNKIVSLLGMDALAIRDQINVNPNIKDIDYAFMVAGANMNTESQAEMDYLFRFWELCGDRQTSGQAQLDAWTTLPQAQRPKPTTNSLVIQDPESKNGAYKITIEWDYVKKIVVDGLISLNARVNHYTMLSGTSATFNYTTRSTRSQMDSTVVYIRKQISASQYEELQISGAVHKNDVYEGKTVETLAKDARAEPTKNEGFIIPLHMSIFDSMPLTKRTQLAQECIYLVFNCYVKTKQKWYQTGVFKFILAIIGIIMIVSSFGSLTPAVAGAYASMALAVGVSAIVLYTATMLVIGYLLPYLLGKWAGGFEAVFGKKWAAVVTAIIGIMASAYAAGGFSTAGGWLKTAVQIIDIASSLFSAYVKGASLELKGQYDAFMDKVEEDKKALDKLSSEFFGDNDLVSIDYLLELQKTLREDSPTVFLTRTLLTGSDVVDITLGQISEMVSMNTTPRLQGIFA